MRYLLILLLSVVTSFAGTYGGPSGMINTAILFPQQVPTPLMLWTAESFAGQSNLTVVTNWPDVSGHGNTITGITGVTNYATGINGHPALYSTGFGLCSNTTVFNQFLAAGFDTNMSMTVVYHTLNAYGPGTSIGTLVASGASDDNFQFYPFGQGVVAQLYVNSRQQTEMDYYVSTTLNNTHVVTMSRTGTNIFIIDNERYEGINSAVIPDMSLKPTVTTNMGFNSGSLYLFNGQNHSRPCPAMLALVRVDYPPLTIQQAEAYQAQLDAYYQNKGGAITMIGESQMQSQNGTNNPAAILSSMFWFQNLGLTCEVQAWGGIGSADHTNNYSMLNGVQRSGPQVTVVLETQNAGDVGNLAIQETNILWLAASAHTNGQKFVLCTPPDYSGFDPGGSGTAANWLQYSNLNNWETNYWQGFADGLANITQDPLLGATNCFTNGLYHLIGGSAGGHLNAQGVMYWTTNYLSTVIQGVLAGQQIMVSYGGVTVIPPSAFAQVYTGTFNGNGAGVTNIQPFLIQTNFIISQFYTNTYGCAIQVMGSVVLTTASATVGSASCWLEAQASPLVGGWTNRSTAQTTATTLADTYTNTLSIFVPTNSAYCFTNFSTGSGNSVTVVGGQIKYP